MNDRLAAIILCMNGLVIITAMITLVVVALHMLNII